MDTRAALKAYFETGDKPTQAQFESLIDSIPNITDDGIQVKAVKVSLTAAQLKTGQSVPVIAIAAPGVGKAIEVISCSEKWTAGDTQLDPGVVGLNTDTGDIYFTDGGMDYTSSFFSQMALNGGGDNLVENKGVYVYVDQDSGAGTATADFYIVYRVITL